MLLVAGLLESVGESLCGSTSDLVLLIAEETAKRLGAFLMVL
jgi:hypothetical protein